MSDALYVAKATVEKVDGLHRRATLEDGTSLDFGVVPQLEGDVATLERRAI